jgi:hypothetical protein
MRLSLLDGSARRICGACAKRLSHSPALVRQSYDGFQAKDVTVNEQARRTEQLERKRPQLRAVAYSMLGSVRKRTKPCRKRG